MRLIDADELKKNGYQLQRYSCGEYGTAVEIKQIDDIPTAYDLDKVVEQLEEKADKANDKWMAYGQEDDYFDGKEDGIREAIEIVKKGGAE